MGNNVHTLKGADDRTERKACLANISRHDNITRYSGPICLRWDGSVRFENYSARARDAKNTLYIYTWTTKRSKGSQYFPRSILN